MLLLRASNMNVMQLHVAMARRDRRLALEAFDRLVALDGQIKDLLEDVRPADQALGEVARRLDDRKAALTSQKLFFVAGKTGPAFPGDPEMPAAAPSAGEPETARRLDFSALVGSSEPEAPARLRNREEILPEDIRRERIRSSPRRSALIVAAIFLLAPGTAALLYLLGVDTLPAFGAEPLPVEPVSHWVGGL